jgi:hypothetical protein
MNLIMELLPVIKHALVITFFVFVMMYAQGLVPFSILFTASFVQDGHGMLPLLSYSLKDSVLIKVFNLAFGLIVGGTLFALGF